MKLKSWVKKTLSVIVIVLVIIISIIVNTKYEKDYEECMIKNNNDNSICHSIRE